MAKRKLNFSSSSAVFDRVKAFKAVKDDDLEPSLAPPAPTDASRDASLSNSAAIGDVSPSTDAASAEVASALNDEDRFFSGDGMSGHERALFEVINTVEAQEVVDEAAVKGMSSKLAKALIKNQEMRVRFPDQPEKFMDSETQLVEQIGAFTRVGEHPELYEALTSAGVLDTAAQLLSHENADVAHETIKMLISLTEMDPEDDESAQEASNRLSLLKALYGADIVSLLISNYRRCQEDGKETQDEGETSGTDNGCMYDILTLVENIISGDPASVSQVLLNPKLMSLLIDELKQSRSLKYWTATRQYAAEILSALLMDAEQVRLFLKLDGIDALLTVCACFRKANVALDEPLHQEMTENVFDALAAVLSQPEGRSAFFDAEGIALLLLILKARNVAQRLALKALSYFLSIDAPSIYCDQFVQDMGLGVVMPYLLVRYTPKQASSRSHVSSKQIQKQAEAIEQEDYLIAALWVMFHKLTGSSLVRLIRKFMEKDGEKIDRLLEMLDVRLRRVDVAHDTLTAQHASELYQQSVTAEEREALYESGMLDAGLLSLQQLAYILIVLATLSEENNPDDSANVSSCKASDDVSEPQLGPASQTVFDQASSLAKERILYHFQLEKADPLVLRDVLAVYVDNLENESVEADLCSLLIDNYTSLFASEQKSDK